MDLETLTVLLGWCSVLNIIILTVSGVMLIIFKSSIIAIHSKIFGISEENLIGKYFSYLGNYKVAMIVLNIVPYLSLKMMGY